jgi:hypothetical protein
MFSLRFLLTNFRVKSLQKSLEWLNMQYLFQIDAARWISRTIVEILFYSKGFKLLRMLLKNFTVLSG